MDKLYRRHTNGPAIIRVLTHFRSWTLKHKQQAGLKKDNQSPINYINNLTDYHTYLYSIDTK